MRRLSAKSPGDGTFDGIAALLRFGGSGFLGLTAQRPQQ
jgi:hypothetical protein